LFALHRGPAIVVGNLQRLFQQYILRRVGNDPSAIVFWYLPEPARVINDELLTAYQRSASPSPHYLIDYSPKLRYRCVDSLNVPVLNYGAPLGRQRNPEAIFQFALALHDVAMQDGPSMASTAFESLAYTMLEEQDGHGRWPYTFSWLGSPAPWYSALAQSRGASVMLRAWMRLGDSRFRDAALQALSLFSVPIEDGGFLARHRGTGSLYFEEYPDHLSAVLNGFVACLFGIYEVGFWLKEASASQLFNLGVTSIEAMLPSYTTSRWSLYDHDTSFFLRNYHSPRYHRMMIGYLRVLEVLSQSLVIHQHRVLWERNDTVTHRLEATGRKLLRKLMHH